MVWRRLAPYFLDRVNGLTAFSALEFGRWPGERTPCLKLCVSKLILVVTKIRH